MGNLRACFAFAAGLAACGNDHATVDALKPIDAAIDAKPIDAEAIDASLGDFSCVSNPAATTAPATVTFAGTTDTLSGMALGAVGSVVLDAYKVSDPTTVIGTVTSDAVAGTFSKSLDTGLVPLDAFVKGTKAAYRTTYLYPPNPLAADATGVLFPIISDATFTMVSAIATQDDSVNGALFIIVADCSGTALGTATLTVTQAGAPVGTVFNIGQFVSQLAGYYFVFNVPDGPTQIQASVGSLTFPTTARTVQAYKKPSGDTAEGTITFTQIVPGPPS